MMAQREARAPGAKAAAGGGGRHVAAMEVGGGGGGERAEPRAAWWAAAAAVAGVGLVGAGVLVWWAVAFHPTHQQLWMVPVGLVLLGTPLLAWLSLFASGACRWLSLARPRADQHPVVPDPER